MILKKEEKERFVIKLAIEGLTSREMANAVLISLKDIGTIIRKYNGGRGYQNTSTSITSKAFKIFENGKRRIDVTIDLELESYEVISLFHDYLRLLNLDRLVTTYQHLGDDLPIFFKSGEKDRSNLYY